MLIDKDFEPETADSEPRGSNPPRKTAIVIGSGIGGLSCAMRLQSLGFDSQVVEALDAPGGRAYVRRADGFTFDMGPTVRALSDQRGRRVLSLRSAAHEPQIESETS